MEIEHVIPRTSRIVDEERLVGACCQFADVLTGRGWDKDTVLTARSQREVKRLVTFTEKIGPAAELKTERCVTVSADFYAEKELSGFYDENDKPLLEEKYTISAGLREQVRPDELPEWVLQKLMQNPVFRAAGEPEEELGSTISELAPALDHNALYAFEYEKVTEVEYTLDDEGGLEDFSITCRYLFEEQFIDQRTFSWAEEMMEQLEDISQSEGAMVREDVSTSLTEEDVLAFQETFDEVMRSILSDGGRGEAQVDTETGDDEEERDEIGEIEFQEAAETAEEHYRRAFGIVALNAQGYVGMRRKVKTI